MYMLEIIGDKASNMKKHDEAFAAYSAVLSLGPSAPNNVLIKWANTVSINGSVNEALGIATKVYFMDSLDLDVDALCC
jgi:hypothetical protein